MKWSTTALEFLQSGKYRIANLRISIISKSRSALVICTTATCCAAWTICFDHISNRDLNSFSGSSGGDGGFSLHFGECISCIENCIIKMDMYAFMSVASLKRLNKTKRSAYLILSELQNIGWQTEKKKLRGWKSSNVIYFASNIRKMNSLGILILSRLPDVDVEI
jgi:hypothetical protein